MLEELLKELMKAERKIKKNFIKAEKLGICNGDRIYYKDGEVSYVKNAEELVINYKQIETVERPVEWEEIKIRKPRFRGVKGE